MNRRILSLILALTLTVCVFAGCSAVNDIAGSVAEAAKKELENQVSQALESYKLDVVEVKTATGKLNDSGEELQLFCAALVRCETDEFLTGCADALGKLFTAAGVAAQTGSKVSSSYLKHKELVFDHTDFSDGNYYILYVYSALPTVSLPATEGK